MIAIVYPQFYRIGGIARYLDSFLANLPGNSPPVFLVTSHVEGAPRSYPGVQIINVPLPQSRGGLIVWGLRARRVLRDLHRTGRIRAVNFHFPPLIPGLVLPPRIPIILTTHSTYGGMSGGFDEPRQFASQWGPASLAVKMWMERRIFARATKILALTQQGEREVRRYGFEGPVAIVPNGTDVRQFAPDPSGAKRFDVLFCGRIERGKGSQPMVALCKALIAADPNIRIAIVGYGEDEEYARRELASSPGNVHFSGKAPFAAMPGYYNSSRVYVSTSYYEGLPGTCLEAMAMQLPVVVWDLLCYKGLVAPGRTGFVVPTNNLAGMVDRVMDLLRDSATAERFGRAGRDLLTQAYDWRVLAPRILAALT